MNTSARSWISILVALIILCLVVWTMPKYALVPRGIVLPVNGTRSPITTNVVLYNQLNAPFDAESIGVLSLMYYMPSNTVDAQMIFSQAVAQFVQKAGGNGLQVIQSFYVPPGSPSGGVSILRGNVLLKKGQVIQNANF